MVCCKRGVADSTDMSQIRLYSGSAFVSFGPVWRRIGLAYALHALRAGHVPFLLLYGLRCASPLCSKDMALFRCIRTLKVSARRRIPSAIRSLRYWDFFHLYGALDDVDGYPAFVSCVRRKLTLICKRL